MYYGTQSNVKCIPNHVIQIAMQLEFIIAKLSKTRINDDLVYDKLNTGYQNDLFFFFLHFTEYFF